MRHTLFIYFLLYVIKRFLSKEMKKSTRVLVFHDGNAVTTGIPLYNWKNVIKLIPLLIQPDVLSFSVPLCLSGVLVTKHILP